MNNQETESKELTPETPKTRFCQKCDQEITKDKEIRIEKRLKWAREDKYEHHSSISGESVFLPTEIAIYYLCRECFKAEEKKIKPTPKYWNWVIWPIIVACLIVLWILSLWKDWKK